MLRKIAFAAIPLIFLAAFTAKADDPTTAQVYFSGQDYFADPATGVAISPYGGTVDGQSAQLFCVDYNDHISPGTGWTADVTTVGPTTDYSDTLQKNETTYLEFAWLITMELEQTTKQTAAEYQWAIWALEGTDVPDPYGMNSALDGDAQTAVADGFTANGWLILTPADGYGQEFMTMPMTLPAPEPGTLLLLSAGMIALLGSSLYRQRTNL